MIPKVIHYCWFGRNPLPKIVIKCIDSWKKVMPEYEIVEWNEENVPISEYKFMRDAYKGGKWAFVSDFARYWILDKYGGFFLDTDVEAIKPFDPLCEEQLFFAFQNHVKRNVFFVAPGLIIGSEKAHPYIKKILNTYNELEFVDNNGNYHLELSSPRILTRLLLNTTNLKIENELQHLDNGITIYPTQFFDPYNPRTIFGKGVKLTEDTYSVHHGAASWVKKSDKVKRILSILCRSIIGDGIVDKMRGSETI